MQPTRARGWCWWWIYQIAFCLFTCQKLVVLKLKGRIKLKLPSTVCLPSLKTLHLRLTLLNNESTHKILSNCPLLYDVRLEHDVMSKLHIAMPSLQRLTIVIESIFGPSSNLLDCYFRRLEKISTPSLKYLNIQDFASILYVRFRIKSPSNFEVSFFVLYWCWDHHKMKYLVFYLFYSRIQASTVRLYSWSWVCTVTYLKNCLYICSKVLWTYSFSRLIM